MDYLYGLRLSSNEASIPAHLRASFAQFFALSAPIVPTLSPTAVVAEPTCAKLRQTEALELREARDFFC